MRYPDYYVLNLPSPISASRASGTIPASVAVREFRAPQYLRQGPIVYRPESEEIAFYDYHYWAEDPRQSVTTAIVRDLKQVFKSVEPYDGRTGAEFLLTGSLDHLEEVDGGAFRLGRSGNFSKASECKDRQCDVSNTSFKTSEVGQHSLPAVVAEMSSDLSEAAAQLVSSMRRPSCAKLFWRNND